MLTTKNIESTQDLRNKSDKRTQVFLIVLDNNLNDPNFLNYESLNPEKKMEVIFKRIEKIAEELERIKCDHAIIALREYAVTTSLNERSISQDNKKNWKEGLLNLSKKYPHITIVGGTVSTKKYYYSENELTNKKNQSTKYRLKNKKESIEATYRNYPIYTEIMDYESRSQGSKSLKSEKQKLKSIDPLKDSEGAYVIRNTSYVISSCFFSKGNAQIIRHDKRAPYHEDLNNVSLTGKKIIYQPAKGRNYDNVITLLINDEIFTINLEICRENMFGIESIFNNGIPSDSHFSLQLNCSDTITMFPGHATYAISVDSLRVPQLLKLEENKHLEIIFYYNNLLNEDEKLTGPIPPVFPFEKEVLKILDEAISNSTNANEIDLHSIKFSFSSLLENNMTNATLIYDNLISIIKKYEARLKNKLKNQFVIEQPSFNDELSEKIYRLCLIHKINFPFDRDIYQLDFPVETDSSLVEKTTETLESICAKQLFQIDNIRQIISRFDYSQLVLLAISNKPSELSTVFCTIYPLNKTDALILKKYFFPIISFCYDLLTNNLLANVQKLDLNELIQMSFFKDPKDIFILLESKLGLTSVSLKDKWYILRKAFSDDDALIAKKKSVDFLVAKLALFDYANESECCYLSLCNKEDFIQWMVDYFKPTEIERFKNILSYHHQTLKDSALNKCLFIIEEELRSLDFDVLNSLDNEDSQVFYDKLILVLENKKSLLNIKDIIFNQFDEIQSILQTILLEAIEGENMTWVETKFHLPDDEDFDSFLGSEQKPRM